jgi:two-component system, cell cycle sensor histidine kinase DivJ
VDRAAYVYDVSPNTFDVFHLKQYEMKQTAFFNRVHVADKVILLSSLDDVHNEKINSRVTIRLSHGSSYHTQTQAFKQVECSLFPLGDKIMMIMKAAESPIIKNAEGSGIGKTVFSVMSHELRTPLNAIIGFSDLMSKGLAGDIANDKQRQYIHLIHKSGEQLLELIGSILDLSKLENGTFELEPAEFLPQQVVENVTSNLAENALEKEINLHYMPLCGLQDFFGDHRVVQQIITHLLSNALKFTKNKGTIELTVDIDAENKLIIHVKDNGIGMTSEELRHVSKPFYQASGGHNRAQEGAGLGLALVRHLSVLHGGDIEISSEKNIGTSVRVVLTELHVREKITPLFEDQHDLNPYEKHNEYISRKSA